MYIFLYIECLSVLWGEFLECNYYYSLNAFQWTSIIHTFWLFVGQVGPNAPRIVGIDCAANKQVVYIGYIVSSSDRIGDRENLNPDGAKLPF